MGRTREHGGAKSTLGDGDDQVGHDDTGPSGRDRCPPHWSRGPGRMVRPKRTRPVTTPDAGFATVVSQVRLTRVSEHRLVTRGPRHDCRRRWALPGTIPPPQVVGT